MKRILLLIICFFCVWTALGVNLSQRESLTFDEPVHAKAGFLYNQGIYDFDPIEPPLVRQSVVSIANLLSIVPYRVIIVVINGVLLSFLVYLVACESLGAGIFAATFMSLEPNLLAYGHYFTTDMISSVLAVLGLYYLLQEKWKSKWGWRLMILFLGLAAAAKVSMLVLIVPLLIWKVPKLGKRKVLILVVTLPLIIWATYLFHFDQPARQIHILLPFGGYLRALKENIQFAMRGQSIYFLGKIYMKGPWFKQPLVLLLKTSIPLLILSVISLKTNPKSRVYLPIIVVGLIINIMSSLHFGMRHMLPLLITIVLVASQLKLTKVKSLVLLLTVVVWQISNLLVTWPQPIVFSNELSLGNSMRIFSDSDLDWGQGTIELKETIDQRRITSYQLAYFGNIDPKTVLGEYTRIKDENPVATQAVSEYDPQRPTIISETCYYLCGYYQDPRFSLEKSEVLAHSFLYFHD